MSHSIVIDEEATGIPSDEVLADETHQLAVKIDNENSDIYLSFSTREAMRDFAKSLLQESIYGNGSVELYPLNYDGKQMVVDGVRLSSESPRVFIDYADKDN